MKVSSKCGWRETRNKKQTTSLFAGDAFLGVPGVVASGPGQGAREGREEVVEGPRDHHYVVNVQPARHDRRRVTHPLQQTPHNTPQVSFSYFNFYTVHTVQDNPANHRDSFALT